MRKLPGLVALVLLALVLVACGSSDSKKTPTPGNGGVSTTVSSETPESPTQPLPTVASVTEVVATPAATAVASPVAGSIASPMPSPLVPSVASPVASPAIPSAAFPVASPAASPVGGATVTLQGVVKLPGTANEDFLLSADGCMGLGQYAGLSVGQQVVVRDQAGTIVGVTQLNSGGDRVSCEWTFKVEVPTSTFYEVTLPMVGDRVFSADEVESGPVTLTLP